MSTPFEELYSRVKKLEQTLEVKPTTKDCSPGHVYWRSRAHLAEERLEKAERYITARNEELRTKAETETAHNAKRDELYESLRLSNAEKGVYQRCAEGRREEIEQLEAQLEKWKRGDFIVPANGHNQFDLDEINKLEKNSKRFLRQIEEAREARNRMGEENRALRESVLNKGYRPIDNNIIKELDRRNTELEGRAATWRTRAIDARRQVRDLKRNLETAREVRKVPLGLELRSGIEVHVLVYGYKTQFQFQVAGVFTSRDLMFDWIRENPAAAGEETEYFTYTINEGAL